MTDKKTITLLKGDGIGPEVVEAAVAVLKAVEQRFGRKFQFVEGHIGGTAIDQFDTPLPEETVAICRASDAILLGAVGGPKWDKNPSHLRPEAGLLQIRKALQLYANVRPVSYFESTAGASPLKQEVIENIDLVIVRELTGGIYFGERGRKVVEQQQVAYDTLTYSEQEIERIVELAFQYAAKRKRKVTSVDKANVLDSSRLWREVTDKVAARYPHVAYEHMLVDNAAMQLVCRPNQFDVVVTENMFGDILSDEASVITGSLGMLPSASIAVDGPNLYEPIHGSAPDIAGQNKANPVGTILSAAMMLRHSFGYEREAKAIEQAVQRVLEKGFRTADIQGEYAQAVSTTEFVAKVSEQLVDHAEISQIMTVYS